jgi:hypothetical protein
VVSQGTGALSCLLSGGGARSSFARRDVPLCALPTDLSFADLNGDFNADAVASCEGGDSVCVLLGDGRGSFSPVDCFSAGPQPQSVVLEDFDRDGWLDALVALRGNSSLALLLGDGAGGFSAPVFFPLFGERASGLATGDFDGDGLLDAAVTAGEAGLLLVLRGDGRGGFGAPLSFPSGGTLPGALLAADLNGDGLSDLAVANAGSDSVAVFLQIRPRLERPHNVYRRMNE